MSDTTVGIPDGAKLTLEFEYHGKQIKLTQTLDGSELKVHYEDTSPVDFWENYSIYSSDRIVGASLHWPVDDNNTVYKLEVENNE